MNKLQQYLQNNAIDIEDAIYTNSLYYNIQGIIVRYSDHLNNNGTCDINIVRALNDPIHFIVTSSDVSKAYIFNAKNAIQFITNSIAFINLTKIKSKEKSFILSEDDIIDMEELNYEKFKAYSLFYNKSCLGISKILFVTFKSKFPKSCSLSTLKEVIEWAKDNQGANQTKVSKFIKSL